jgi:hypothetical protein
MNGDDEVYASIIILMLAPVSASALDIFFLVENVPFLSLPTPVSGLMLGELILLA